jgi:hypothetical protein
MNRQFSMEKSQPGAELFRRPVALDRNLLVVGVVIVQRLRVDREGDLVAEG